jgi:hypothetical protein
MDAAIRSQFGMQSEDFNAEVGKDRGGREAGVRTFGSAFLASLALKLILLNRGAIARPLYSTGQIG